MFEYINNTLCIKAESLYSDSELGLMSYSTYDRRLRAKIKIAVPGGNGRKALVEYDSIPQELREQIRKIVGKSPYELALMNRLADTIKQDAKASDFFNNYIKPDGKHLSQQELNNKMANANVLNALRVMMNDRRAKRNGKRIDMWDELSALVNALDSEVYPHNLPSKPVTLKRKFQKYEKEGYTSLLHGNIGNDSAAKVDDDIKESVIKELLADPRNLDNEQVRKLYNIMAKKMEWAEISRSAVAVWREKLEMEIYASRRGETAFRNKKAMQVKRTAPTAPLYYLTMDGWDVELLYQKTVEGANGNNRITYHNRLTVVVVLDPCVKYPVGYAIGTHETPELIKEALRNAANHTREIFGSRYKTHQLQSDHYAIKKMTDVYEMVADKVTPARVKNAKAKVIEPYFKSLNKKYCQLMPNWSGFGVTSKKESQPNVDFLNKFKNNFPDEAGCRMQITRMMEMERAEKIERYKELWNNVSDDDRLLMSDQEYLMTFGAETGHKNILEGTGLRPTIAGTKMQYDCFDINFREHSSVRWTIKYDPDDLSKVLAVNDDATLRFVLEEKYTQPMALKERKEGDYPALARINEFNKQLEKTVTERRALSGGKVAELFEAHPELNDTLAKFVLADSKGQHKDRRNDSRVLEEPPQPIKKKTKAQKIEEEDDEFSEDEFYKLL